MTSYQDIRKAILKNDKTISSDDPEIWLKDTPKDTRVEAIRSFCKNLKTCFSNLKNKNIKRFEMRFMSKKLLKQEIFHVNGKHITSNLKIFVNRLKKDSRIRITNKSSKWLKRHESSVMKNGKFAHFVSIIKQKHGGYYLVIPYNSVIRPNNLPVLDEIVALDPGVRTFQTFYSENTYGKIGDSFTDRIDPINFRIDNINSALTRKSKKGKLLKRCSKLRNKVSNIVNDLHIKATTFLTRSYKTILLPSFETKQMVKKRNNRVMTSSTVRKMQCLSHYSFKQRIMSVASELTPQVKVIICDESYTSKTCGICGDQHPDLKSKKVFDCRKCGSKIDRDINGARNILIKSLTSYLTKK